jgi:dihydropteroate synthase
LGLEKKASGLSALDESCETIFRLRFEVNLNLAGRWNLLSISDSHEFNRVYFESCFACPCGFAPLREPISFFNRIGFTQRPKGAKTRKIKKNRSHRHCRLPLSDSPTIFRGMTVRQWKLARRSLPYGERTLVMGVLNVTPDSFSDGGRFLEFDRAVAQAEQMIGEGADIIDVGGESTRPGSEFVSEEEESGRVIPVIKRLASESTVPISIDTTKSVVARAALAAGAEIVNDISGLRFDPAIADEAAKAKAGLILMHSRGVPKNMQQIPPVADVIAEVIQGLRQSVALAEAHAVARESIAVDPGIGFGKTGEQNVELIAKLDELIQEFSAMPLIIGTSRKSFIGKLLDDAPANERLYGTIASVVAAALQGAHIVRVHNVKPAVEALRIADAIREKSKPSLAP